MGGGSRVFGLGILVSAKDDGASRAIQDVAKETDALADSAKDAGGQTALLGSKWDTFVSGLQLHRLSQISDSLAGMARQAGTALPAMGAGIALASTGIESTAVAFQNSYRQMTAGLGDYEAALAPARRQIAGLAYDLDGVSGEAMLGANVAVVRAGKTLEDYGISQRALAGLINTNLVDGPAFGQMLVTWSDGYGLGAEGAGALADQMIALGESVGDVGGVMAGLPGVMQAMDQAASEFPEMAGDMDRYALSTVKLAAAMQKQGLGSLQDTTAAATQVFTTLAGSRRNLTNLFTGLGSDFDNLAQELGIATGDIGGAVESVMNDPFEFARAMNAMTNEGGRSAAMAQRLRTNLVNVAPNLAFLADGGADAAAVFDELSTATEGAEGALDRVGRAGAHTSRTLSESMERSQDAFTTRLNSMSRSAVGGAGSILAQQRDTYSTITGTIEKFSADSGPMGMLTRGFLRSRAGLFGFTSALDAVGGPVLDMAAQLAPLVSTLGAMGGPIASGLATFNSTLGGMPGKLLGILGPIALLAGAGYLIYKNWDKLGELWDTGLKKLSGFSDKLPNMAQKFSEWVGSIDWEVLGNDVAEGILGAFTSAGDDVAGEGSQGQKIASNFGKFFKVIFEAIPKMVVPLITGLWTRVVAFVTEPEDLMGKLRRGAGILGAGFVATLFTPLRGIVLRGGMRAITSVFGRLGGFLSGGGGLLSGAGLKAAASKLPIIGPIIGVLFSLPEIIEQAGEGDYTGAFQTLWTSAADGLLLGIPSLLDSLLGTDVFGNALDFLFRATNFGRLADAISEGNVGEAIFEGLFTVVNSAMMGIPGMFRTMLEDMGMGDVFGGMSEGLSETFGGMVTTASDFFVGNWEAAKETFLSITDFVDGFVEKSAPLVEWLGDVFTRVWTGMKRLFKSVMAWIAPLAKRVFTFIGGVFTWLWETILKPVVDTFRDLFVDTMAYIRENFASWVMSIGTYFIVGMETISAQIDLFEGKWNALINILSTTGQIIGSEIVSFFVDPFLKAQNSVSKLADMFGVAFSSMRATMLELKADIFDFFVSMASSLPGVSDLFGDELAGMATGAATARTAARRIRDDESLAATARREEREQRDAERAASAAERTRLNASRTQSLAVMNEEDPASRNRIRQRDANVARTVGQLGEAVEGGAQSQAQGAARRAEERRVEARAVPTAPVLDGPMSVPEAEDVTPAVSQGRGRGRRSAPTREEQQQDAQQVSARRQELADEARTAQRSTEARADVKSAIQSFGPTAIQQLADAMTIRIPRSGLQGSNAGG